MAFWYHSYQCGLTATANRLLQVWSVVTTHITLEMENQYFYLSCTENVHTKMPSDYFHCLLFKEMTLNKMVWNFWHQFLIRFSMLFQMVPFILLCMVAHLTITWLVETIPTANQRALCWWFLKLPWREKRKVPSERAMKTESETGVKSDTPFCLWLQKWNGKQTVNLINISHVLIASTRNTFWNKVEFACVILQVP